MTKYINRYKFSPQFIEKIKLFCENNKHLNNEDFKKKYELWKNENIIMINNEKQLLFDNGFIGDFYNKLNKSILYYFKNNFLDTTSYNDNKNDNNNKNDNDNKNTRQYLIFDIEFLELIDLHINRHFNSNYKINAKLLFNDFKNLYHDEITNQINNLKNEINDEKKLNNKVKKTYQNRYYNINKLFNN